MSFMPNPGTLVKMKNGRLAKVSNVDPLGENDRITYMDTGEEEKTDAWQIAEVLDEKDD